MAGFFRFCGTNIMFAYYIYERNKPKLMKKALLLITLISNITFGQEKKEEQKKLLTSKTTHRYRRQ